jgi:hypothetical protein
MSALSWLLCSWNESATGRDWYSDGSPPRSAAEGLVLIQRDAIDGEKREARKETMEDGLGLNFSRAWSTLAFRYCRVKLAI